MLDNQIREQRIQKGNEIEEENWVFKANYGPEETYLSTQILGDKRENEKIEMSY